MAKRQNRVPLKDLNLADRFLFDEVMEDPQAHQDALSIIFGREIMLLGPNETEKELRVSPLLRSIRMDVVSMDDPEKQSSSWKNEFRIQPRRQEKQDQGRVLQHHTMVLTLYLSSISLHSQPHA